MILQIPSELEQQLQNYSRIHGKTEQQMLKDILRQVLPEVTSMKKRTWVGMASSGRTDLSERVDELLFAEKLGSLK